MGTVLHLVRRRLQDTGHHSGLVAYKAHIDSGDQVGGCVYGQVDIWPAYHDRPILPGDQIDIRLCGVHLIAPRLWPPPGRRSPNRPVIPLVFGKAFSRDNLLRGLMEAVLIVVVPELAPCGGVAVQLTIRPYIIFQQHHLIGRSQG